MIKSNRTLTVLSYVFTSLLIQSAILGSLALAKSSREGETHGKLFDRVIVVVLENTNYDEAIQNPDLSALAKKGALLSNFDAISHPSYPNYLAMVAGSTFHIENDNQINLEEKSIADLLERHGLTWKNYAEGYPGNCYLGKTSKSRYARKHVPFLSFTSIQNDSKRCSRVVNGEQFSTDWKTRNLPQYSFFTPDMDHDGHDTDTATAAGWLKNFLAPLLSDTVGMERTLIEVTFDESESYSGRNQVMTFFLGSMIQPGSVVATKYDHFDMLRTVQDNFSLGTLGKEDEKANAIQGIWKKP